MAMAPAGILFEEIAPNSSSSAFRASRKLDGCPLLQNYLPCPQHSANCGTESLYLALSWARTKRKVMPVTADTVNELTSPAATATLRASRTLLLSLPPGFVRRLGSCSLPLLVVPTYRGDSGVFTFTIEFGPGGHPRFPRPCVSNYSGLRLCKPDFLFCSSPGALGLPPVLRIIANSLQREESYMPSPTPTSCSWPA